MRARELIEDLLAAVEQAENGSQRRPARNALRKVILRVHL
jgi:hypothetical protein